MEKENTLLLEEQEIVGNHAITVHNFYDFNLYPLHLVEPGNQLYIVPTETGDLKHACFIVRKGDYAANRVSHMQFAKHLVNNRRFLEMEELAYQNSGGTTSRWRDWKNEYFGQEFRYLIEKKGYILYSPPHVSSKVKTPLANDFIPKMNLMTTQQIHNFFYLLEMNPALEISKEIEAQMLSKITTKKAK